MAETIKKHSVSIDEQLYQEIKDYSWKSDELFRNTQVCNLCLTMPAFVADGLQ